LVCILYVIAVGTLLGMAGLLVERVLPPTTTSRRWIWCAVIAINVIVPGIYQAKHRSSVTDVLEHHVVHSRLGHTVGTASLNALDQGLAARIESLNPTINRLWTIVSWMLVLWGLATAARVYFLVARSRRRGTSRAPSMVDGVPVLVTDSMGPATVGVLRSRVLVPQWVLALPRVQRRYVLRHEEEHRNSRDALLLFVASLTLILMPWNAALWWQLRRLRLAVEMDCDNRVVSALGDANAYGELLFKVAQAASRGPRLQPAFLGAGMLERRLSALVAPTPLRHFQRFLLPAVALGLLFVVLSMPHPFLEPGSNSHVAPSAPAAEVIVHR
jgi:beta-lactamase regulating signal transducer with metallopeptidase domain